MKSGRLATNPRQPSEVIQIGKENHIKKGAYCLTRVQYLLMSGKTKAQAKIQAAVKIGTRYHQRKSEGGKENIFKLTPIKSVYYKQAVSISFQPRKVKISDQQEKGIAKGSIVGCFQEIEFFSITPKFNKDSKYYTPSFVLPFDAEQPDQDVKHCHDIKTKECIKQIDYPEIMIPKPKSKSQFCAVCRQHYRDYLQHVRGSSHRHYVRSCEFSNDIEVMSHYFRETIKNNGVVTRSNKRRLDNLYCVESFEPAVAAAKRRKTEAVVVPFSKREKEEFGLQGLTPSNKRSVETTVKQTTRMSKPSDFF